MNRLLPLFGILVFLTLPAHAQTRSLAVQTGALSYDLSGVGTTPLISVNTDWAATRHVVFQGGVTAAFPDQTAGRTTLLIPEGSVQYQWPLGKFAPFVSGGIGAA